MQPKHQLQIVDVVVDDLSILTEEKAHQVFLHCRNEKGAPLTVYLNPEIFGAGGSRRQNRHLRLAMHLLGDAYLDAIVPDTNNKNALGNNKPAISLFRGKFFRFECKIEQGEGPEWIAHPNRGKPIDPFHLPTEEEMIAACDAELGL